MFSLIKKKIFITNNFSKKLNLFSKSIKKLNSKYFFYTWNQHAEYRSSYNLHKSYLLIQKIWYFQKKKFLFIPNKFKNLNISELNNIKYIKIQSKLIDFIKKIF